MKKSLTFWNIFPASLIIAGVLLLIFQALIKRKRQESEEEETVDTEAEIVDEEEDPISKEQRVKNNYLVIRKAAPANVSDDFIKILAAQAMHETAIFNSRMYLEQNNLFGMGHPVIRDTTSLGEVKGFANYATLDDSVTDLFLWFKEFSIKPTYTSEKDYVKDIRQKGYFTAPFIDYFNATRKHLATVKNLIQ